MHLQRTLKREVTIEGVGLHTGNHACVRLSPAPRDNGIVFYRKDRNVLIRADVNSVSDTAFATTLGLNGTKIKTVEHLLASVSGLGIDNLFIEVNGNEIPILDGSAAGFVEHILDAGIAKQAAERSYIKILRPVAFKEGNSEVCALPSEGFHITYQTYYSHHLLGHQKLSMKVNEKNFIRELAPARTFGFLKEVETLRANGFAKGGSLENAIIMGEAGILNETGLRFEDEFIRHKMLDLVGDLSLVGFPIWGHIYAVRSGHSANLKFARMLITSAECWELTSMPHREGASLLSH